MKRIGNGNTSEIFDLGNGQVLKLFYAEYPKEGVQREFDAGGASPASKG